MKTIKSLAIFLLLFCGLQIVSASDIPVVLHTNLPAGTTWTIRLDDIAEIPNECSYMTPVVDNEPSEGLCVVRNGAIMYISTLPADTTATDQFTFIVNCLANTYTVSANVNIVPKPDNIISADCAIPPEATVWKIDNGRNLGEVVNYVTALVGDMNGDGYPEIVTAYQLGTTFTALPSSLNVPSDNLSLHFAQQVKVFVGPNHTSPIIFRTKYPFCIHGPGVMGIVKTKIETYPGSGIEKDSAIIVVGEGDLYLRAYSMTGDLIWTSSEKWTDLAYSTAIEYLGGSLSASISFADFNNDGYAEVYVGHRIFDAATGVILIEGNENSGHGGEYCTPDMVIAANMYGDERLELVAGNQIYDVVITNRTGTAGNSMTVGKSITPPICDECGKNQPIEDGYSFVVDIDGDGHLDVVVATLVDKAAVHPVSGKAIKSPFIYIWSPYKEEVLARTFVPLADRMGTPFIGDIDGCGRPEILFIAGIVNVPSSYYVYAYKYVEDGEAIPVSNVFLNKNAATLIIGYPEKLTAAVMPSYATNKNVTWSSSNPSVATVDGNGLVTPLTVGTTTITVTTEDGGKTAICAITVQAPVAVIGVSLNKNTTSIKVNLTEKLIATVNPSNATNKNVIWSSSDPSVATVSSTGVVTALDEGTVTITVTTEDGSFTDDCVVTVAGIGVAGITELTFEDNNIGDLYFTERNGSTAPCTIPTVVANPNPSGINTSEQVLKQVVEMNNTVVGFPIVLPEGKTWDDVVEISFDIYSTSSYSSGSSTPYGIFVGLNEWRYVGDNLNNSTPPGTTNANARLGSVPVSRGADPYLWKPSTITVAGEWITKTISAATLKTNIPDFPLTATGFTLYLGVNHEGRTGGTGDCSAVTNPRTFYYDNIRIVFAEDIGPVAVAGVSLNKNTTSIAVSATEQLTATITPNDAANKNVTWSSSDTGVATVSNTGLVTAVGAGTATVTVTTVEGSFTDNCLVTVTSAAPSAVTVFNFENDVAGVTTYFTDRVGTGVAQIATVKANPNPSGINTSTQSLQHIIDYNNTVVGFPVVLPAGKTWADVTSVSFDIYCANSHTSGSSTPFGILVGIDEWRYVGTNTANSTGTGTTTVSNTRQGSMTVKNDLDPYLWQPGTISTANTWITLTIPVTTINSNITISSALNEFTLYLGVNHESRSGSGGDGVVRTFYYDNIKVNVAGYAPAPSRAKSASLRAAGGGISELQLFWKLSHTDNSSMTGLTLFDFNQDGVAEILYRDETTLRIINGSGTGANPSDPSYIDPITKLLYNYELTTPIPCISATGHEYPTIADIDGDGQAEIIVPGSADGPAAAPNGQLRIFKTAGSPWAPARPVWNQFMYNAVNVNDNLTVPKYQLNPATAFAGQDQVFGTVDDVRPYNAFLQQPTILNQYGTSFVPGPDIAFASGFSVISNSSDISISFDVVNGGEGPIVFPLYITIYKESVSSANILQTISFNPGTKTVIVQGEIVSVSFVIPKTSAIDGVHNLIIRLNDDGHGFAINECFTGNNQMQISFYDDFYGFAYDPGQTIALDVLQNDMGNTGAVFMDFTGLPTSTAGSALAILPRDASGRQKLNYTPPVGFFGIDTLDYSATGKNASNIDTPTSAKVYIYIFEDSTLVCLPQVGATDRVNIKIEDKVNDVEVNFFYPATTNSANNLLVTNPLTTPVALRAEVTFNVSNDHLTQAFNNENIPVDYKLEVVPPLLYWNWTSGKPSDNNWNNPVNWLLEDGTPANAVPKLCTIVHIPGNMEKNYYPSLDSLNTVRNHRYGDPECDSIYFHFGGEVKETHRLTYTGAHVEMKINSNQWYMLSAPLNNTYSGDFYIDNHNPVFDMTTPEYPGGRGVKVYMEHFDIANYQTGAPRIPYNWNRPFNTNDIKLLPGQGFALFANPRYSYYDDQTALDDKTFWFPKNDPVHYYHDGAGNELYPGGALNRSKSHRFIYEDIIESTGLVPLTHSTLSEGQMVLVGNPFMAQLDFDAFVTDANNSGLIYDEYKIATGVNFGADGKMNDFSTYKRIGGEWYTSDPESFITTNYIAPMQSFIVHAKPGTSSSSRLKADIVNHTATAPAAINNTLRSSKQEHGISQLLYVTATLNAQKNHAVLIHWPEGSQNFSPEEDSRKLFSEKTTANVLVYLLSKDGITLDINTVSDLTEMIPIGIRTSKTGEITLSFSGMENFSNYDVQLLDAVLNRTVNLSDENEYSFIKEDTDLYVDNRFFIGFSTKPTGLDSQKDNRISVFNPARGIIRIISTEALESIEIFDIHGRRLTRVDSINDKQYSYQTNSSGVYIVKVMGEAKKVIVK